MSVMNTSGDELPECPPNAVEAIETERDVIESELKSATVDKKDQFLGELTADGAIDPSKRHFNFFIKLLERWQVEKEDILSRLNAPAADEVNDTGLTSSFVKMVTISLNLDSNKYLIKSMEEDWPSSCTPSTKLLLDDYILSMHECDELYATVIDRVRQNSQGVELLAKCLSGLRQSIPAGEVSINKDPAVTRLCSLMDAAEAIETERDVIESELNSTTVDKKDQFLGVLAADGAIDPSMVNSTFLIKRRKKWQVKKENILSRLNAPAADEVNDTGLTSSFVKMVTKSLKLESNQNLIKSMEENWPRLCSPSTKRILDDIILSLHECDQLYATVVDRARQNSDDNSQGVELLAKSPSELHQSIPAGEGSVNKDPAVTGQTKIDEELLKDLTFSESSRINSESWCTVM